MILVSIIVSVLSLAISGYTIVLARRSRKARLVVDLIRAERMAYGSIRPQRPRLHDGNPQDHPRFVNDVEVNRYDSYP